MPVYHGTANPQMHREVCLRFQQMCDETSAVANMFHLSCKQVCTTFGLIFYNRGGGLGPLPPKGPVRAPYKYFLLYRYKYCASTLEYQYLYGYCTCILEHLHLRAKLTSVKWVMEWSILSMVSDSRSFRYVIRGAVCCCPETTLETCVKVLSRNCH